MSDGLRVAVDAGVATLWLDRPEKRNAVTYEMWRGIGDRCTELADDPSVRLLVVRGAGGHFCAGADIGGFAGPMPPDYGRVNHAAEVALSSFPKPTIAFITGACVGGGAEIAVACDLRIADTSARFGITPARLGIVYPPFAIERVVRLIGAASAKHLLFSAELIDADRALRIGLVDEVHEPAAATERLAAFTSLLATERSLLTQEASKAMIDAAAETGSIPDDLVERWNREMSTSPDRAEGVAAFLERRPPRFTWPN
ncbi:MAG: Enoyl-CoA hydratase/isomerase [Actinomycetia bacterium]|nr:Enoyl-CoA hydratase/isomerase [Actinomycetes bacterium]